MRFSRFTCYLFALIISLIIVAAGPCEAEQSPEKSILFILDASGSMWGRVEGRSKIEIAREVLQEILSALPQQQPAGIMAYGHRRKGDCADIQMLLPVAAGQNAQLAESVKKLQPRGMTPISEALRKAADGLKYKEMAASLVLVSDGRETCQGDPCAVAKSLHDAGVDLKIYVVGFDVSGSDAAQLQCIADQSGGRYFTADNAQALGQALATIRDHVVMNEPMPQTEPASQAPEAPKVEASGPTSTRVKLKSVATIRLQPAPWVRMPPKYWSIRDAESGEPVGSVEGDSVRIKPGTYQIAWRQVEHGAKEVFLNTTVIAESGETVLVSLDTGIRLTGPEGLENAYYWMLKDEMDQVVAHFWGEETFRAQLVPAGRYRLIWRLTEHGTSEAELGEVEISTGHLLDKVLDAGVVLALPEWLDKPYNVVLKGATGNAFQFRLPGVHPLASGEYSLTWHQTEHGHSPVSLGTIKIQEGKYTALPIDSGLTFLAGEQKPPYRIIATNIATGETGELRGTWGPMPLQPGTYTLDMQEKEHGTSPVRLADDLTIVSGQLLELEI